jgi:zinc transport system permease protein
MAYFGDATAHAAILGVALALAADLPVGLGTLAVALLMAVTVATLAARGWAMDTTLGVLAHSALAFGLVAISFVHGVRTDLSAWLFGDILAVTRGDLVFIWGGAALVVLLLIWRWSALLTATLNEPLPEIVRKIDVDEQGKLGKTNTEKGANMSFLFLVTVKR